MSEVKTYRIEEIMNMLPHRYPFLLVDRLEVEVPGEKGVGIKNVTMNEEFFQGHFPGNPVMPGVLQIEAMAQTAGAIVSCAKEDYAEHKAGVLFPQAGQAGRPAAHACRENQSPPQCLCFQRRGEGRRSSCFRGRIYGHDYGIRKQT